MARRVLQRRLPDSFRVPAGLRELHPVLARIYAARQIEDARELELSVTALVPGERLSQIREAVGLLESALQAGQHILVVGDFDADGATSTTVAMRALCAMGADQVSYLVPNRFEYGYGLTPEIVVVARERSPDLIVTVDNGVSSIEGVAAARDAGLKVLVTDHHLPGPRLPEADAIVNPNIPGDAFPSKSLAGVGVIFYLMLALRTRLREVGWFERRGIPEPKLADLLDLVALGTVADVVPLDRNNRVLVEQGLRRIRAGRCVPGIEALMRISGRDPRRTVASDMGFAIGPRLNAAGRLEDMSLGIECLLTDDTHRASELAERLDGLNRERRGIEAEMQVQALAALERLQGRLSADDQPVGLTLYDPDWHQGVIGILASRIKERFNRPVIAFAPAGNGELKGSARSIPGLHIRDALDSVAARHPGLVSKFGGHAMAAGLSLPEAHFEPFSLAFNEEVSALLSDSDLRGMIESDGELAPDAFDLELAELLRSAGPWGQGFPEPCFDGVFEVATKRIVGERHLKLVLKPEGKGPGIDAIAFNADFEDWPEPGDRVHLVYRLDVNEYRGLRSVQLVVEYLYPD